MPMTVEMRELYSSPNGDRWYLARDVDLGQVFIRHEPNLPSGGKAENIEVGAFLSQSGQGPEHRELLRLIGTLVKRDHSSAEGTAARIKSHAKSYIVELTDGSKWRIWPGDLATTLGWTPDTEIETLPIEDEFCSHVLVDQSHGSRVRAIEASNDWPVEETAQVLEGWLMIVCYNSRQKITAASSVRLFLQFLEGIGTRPTSALVTAAMPQRSYAAAMCGWIFVSKPAARAARSTMA